MPEEIPLVGGGRSAVSRIGDVVHRETGPWASSVHALLRHLEAEGFPGAPRVVGSGFDAEGRETLSFMSGVSLHPGPWPDQAMFNLGQMLAAFHRASMSFVPPPDATWRPWFGRTLGTGRASSAMATWATGTSLRAITSPSASSIGNRPAPSIRWSSWPSSAGSTPISSTTTCNSASACRHWLSEPRSSATSSTATAFRRRIARGWCRQ